VITRLGARPNTSPSWLKNAFEKEYC